MTKNNDQDLLLRICAVDPRKQDAAFTEIYRQFYPAIENMILRNKGTADDARDVFQDALIALYRQVNQGKFEGKSSLKTYFYSICRNTWLKKLAKKKNLREVDEPSSHLAAEDDIAGDLSRRERDTIIQQMLAEMDEGCREVLRLYYFDRLSMRKIAAICGCASEQVAKNKKSRCMKKLRQLVSGNALYRTLNT
jgi:RNA polymerase sigma factor (sigma-70 family)